MGLNMFLVHVIYSFYTFGPHEFFYGFGLCKILFYGFSSYHFSLVDVSNLLEIDLA